MITYVFPSLGLCWLVEVREALWTLVYGARGGWFGQRPQAAAQLCLQTSEAKLVLEVHVRLRLHRLLVDGRGGLLLAPFGAEKPSFFIFFRGLRGFGHDLGTALRCLRILLATRRAEDWAFGWREA